MHKSSYGRGARGINKMAKMPDMSEIMPAKKAMPVTSNKGGALRGAARAGAVSDKEVKMLKQVPMTRKIPGQTPFKTSLPAKKMLPSKTMRKTALITDGVPNPSRMTRRA